jgi:hypothetical protein
MDNSYFIYTTNDIELEIDKFHNCTWEFNSNSSLVEFGFELSTNSIPNRDRLSLTIAIPWCSGKSSAQDLYYKLKDADNSRFIFNDTVNGTDNLDAKSSSLGVIHRFTGKQHLCILPINIDLQENGKVKVEVDLTGYKKYPFSTPEKPNIYFRFSVEPNWTHISTRKRGISKTSIIYDIKINEKRNLSEEILNELKNNNLCKIKQCFCFNILPNSYDIVFFDNTSLKNVRSLEYDSFNRYLGDNRIKKDELIVIFNKKENKDASEIGSFTFFSIYARERIGIAQFSLAILLNVICGLLFFIAAFRTPSRSGYSFLSTIFHLPPEIYIAIIAMAATLVYFLYPLLNRLFARIKSKK